MMPFWMRMQVIATLLSSAVCSQTDATPAHRIASNDAGNGEDGSDLDIALPRHWQAVGWQHHGGDTQRHTKPNGYAAQRF